ncbi:MAG: hypothetical protein M0R77_00700 [Gammaproteobacteria bacterium]|nr:hypothetical protein [Acholeplasmataceae bacterium]MCK9529073.1 hypothetical protein [Gammaproteobacteria bacterium]
MDLTDVFDIPNIDSEILHLPESDNSHECSKEELEDLDLDDTDVIVSKKHMRRNPSKPPIANYLDGSSLYMPSMEITDLTSAFEKDMYVVYKAETMILAQTRDFHILQYTFEASVENNYLIKLME